MTCRDVLWFPIMSAQQSCHVSDGPQCWADTQPWPWDSDYRRRGPTGSAALPSVIWVAVSNWWCLICSMHVIVRGHIMCLLTECLSFQKESWYIYVAVQGSLIQSAGSTSLSGLCVFSLVRSEHCGRTVCWHVSVFVQPRFSSSTECIYRTTPSNPSHSKVACTHMHTHTYTCSGNMFPNHISRWQQRGRLWNSILTESTTLFTPVLVLIACHVLVRRKKQNSSLKCR